MTYNQLLLLGSSAAVLFLTGCAKDTHTYTPTTAKEPTIIYDPTAPIPEDDANSLGGFPDSGVDDGFVDATGDDAALIDIVEGRGVVVNHEIPPVYFAYDSAAIRAAEEPKLQSIIEFMQVKGEYTLVIGGHCDDRGSDDYNRSLSERRALSIKEALLAYAPDMESRIDTVAYGEDKPADTGANSAAYAKNRRGEFEVYAPKQ
jgi:peptidoglycan-associated lipoprotein